MSDDNSEIVNQTMSLLTGIRELREKFMSSLNELQKTRLIALGHEAERLRNISTSVEPDPKVKLLEEDIQGTKYFIEEITNQLEIGRISVPKVKEEEVLIHGRITDENGRGLKNLAVSLILGGQRLDVSGQSDTSGYYSILLPVAIVDKIKQQNNIFSVYVHYRNILVHISDDALKLTSQEYKYEVKIDKSEFKGLINQQGKEEKGKKKIKKLEKN